MWRATVPWLAVLGALLALTFLLAGHVADASARPDANHNRTMGHASASGRSPLPAVSEVVLLDRLADPVRWLSPMPEGVSIGEVSSHDPLNGNFDGGSYSQTSSRQNSAGVIHPSTYVRREAGGYVLLDQAGPGCLTRLWMTSSLGSGLFDPHQVPGDVSAFGRLQAFFDDRARPSIDEPADQLFSGTDPRFPKPLVNNPQASGGGNSSYVPLCFAKRLSFA